MNFAAYIKKNHLELIFAGFFFVLILFSKFAAIYIILMALAIIGNYVAHTIRFQINKFSLLFVALYLTYAIGVFWTQDFSQASKYLENKVVFLLFPFLFSFVKPAGFNIRILYWGLISATLSAFAYGIYIGIPCYIQHFSFPYCFLKSHLSPFMHPTYMSVFALFSMAAAFKLWKEQNLGKFPILVLIGFLLVYTFLLMSLAGLISIFLLVIILSLYYLKNKFSWKVMIGAALLGLIASATLIPSIPFIREDINETLETTKRYSNSPEKFIQNLGEDPSSSETRLVMWSISMEEIKKHPMGVGTGNVDIYLGRNIEQKGNKAFAEKQYNPHNQFLQTQLEIGIIGLIILLAITFGGILMGIKKRHSFLILLFASLLLNSLFESMLQLQAGIIFYLFFFMLLMIAEQSSAKNSVA